MNIESINNCIDVNLLLRDLMAAMKATESEKKIVDFDASCYNGDACNSSSGQGLKLKILAQKQVATVSSIKYYYCPQNIVSQLCVGSNFITSSVR